MVRLKYELYGVKEGVELMKNFDLKPAKWIDEMIKNTNLE